MTTNAIIPRKSPDMISTRNLYPGHPLYPGIGFPGSDLLTVQYYTLAYVFVPATGSLIVSGVGFNISSSLLYRCVYTGVNSTGDFFITNGGLVNATNITSINCGLAPTGFKVINGIVSVNLTVFEVMAGQNGYQVPSYFSSTGITPVVFNACFNRAKDGLETDVDW